MRSGATCTAGRAKKVWGRAGEVACGFGSGCSSLQCADIKLTLGDNGKSNSSLI